MALLSPPPLLFPKPPFPSTLRPTWPRRASRSISTTTTTTTNLSPPPPPAASSPSTSSPALGGTGTRRKKKQAPKPSFEEKALRRWSARAPSRRDTFPWQKPPPPHLAHPESEGARDQEVSTTGSATLKSIVEYFSYDHTDGDGNGGARDDEGVAENGVLPGEAAQDKDGKKEPPSEPSYLLGSQPVRPPWMHAEEESTGHGWASVPVGGGEEEVGSNDVLDDELESVDEDRVGYNGEVVHEEEPLIGSSEGELLKGYAPLTSDFTVGMDSAMEDYAALTPGSYFAMDSVMEDYATSTPDSSIGMDLVMDRGSRGGESDRSVRRSSVQTIVNTLRSSMEENNPNDAIEWPEGEDLFQKLGPVLLPWEREEEEEEVCYGDRPGKRSNTELAERTIPEPELQRLRDVALRMKERMKIGSGGVTQAVVENIHRKWRVDEVVKMRFEGPPGLNMKRTHEILEDRTGGIVIWRSGRSIVLYRGMTYNLQCVQSYAKIMEIDSDKKVGATNSIVPSNVEHALQKPSVDRENHLSSIVNSSLEASETSDADSFLDQLGPRYKDWSGRGPIPVDADLLPGVVPGYKPPIRVLPYKVKSSLRNKEMTNLRRLARQTSPHFALGRNREHQGLATAIVKLWEKSAIAKIAIKRGVPNTCNDRMAEEIRKLTGGVLLSRNKEYIVFYRGNDFITTKVRQVLVEKQEQSIIQQDEEELARLKASASITVVTKALSNPQVAGTLAETTEAKLRWGDPLNDELKEMEMNRMVLAKHTSLLRNLKRKLILAKTKVAKAENASAKVQELLSPAELPTDLETITDEERFLFRKIGLKMRAFLMLGRREVFDGTVQNMHLHWKHRELVKIVVKGKNFAQVKHIAISLEAESGGVLISVDKTTKGYAIIFYRGKNYRRPQILKPRNLLTRRQALARSIELQRREALNHHISSLREKIWKLRKQLFQMKVAGEKQDVELLQTVEDDFSSDDDNIEDEGEEAYLQTHNSEDEEEGG